MRLAPLPCSRQIQTPRGNPNPSAHSRRREGDEAMRGVRADGGGGGGGGGGPSSSSTAGDLFCGYFRSDFVGILSSAVLIVASSGF